MEVPAKQSLIVKLIGNAEYVDYPSRTEGCVECIAEPGSGFDLATGGTADGSQEICGRRDVAA